MHFKKLTQIRPDEVDTYWYTYFLHGRAIQRILKYLSSVRRGDSLKKILYVVFSYNCT